LRGAEGAGRDVGRIWCAQGLELVKAKREAIAIKPNLTNELCPAPSCIAMHGGDPESVGSIRHAKLPYNALRGGRREVEHDLTFMLGALGFPRYFEGRYVTGTLTELEDDRLIVRHGRQERCE
jgi:hypothetical protein